MQPEFCVRTHMVDRGDIVYTSGNGPVENQGKHIDHEGPTHDTIAFMYRWFLSGVGVYLIMGALVSGQDRGWVSIRMLVTK